MTISTIATSLKNRLDAANLSMLPIELAAVKLGTCIREMPCQLNHKTAAAANSYVNATYQAITLPDDAKAGSILAAYGLVGTATAGPFTIATYASGSHPTANEISVGPTGDILFLAADAWTSVDVLYVPAQYDVYEMTLSVVAATGICALPTGTGQPAAGGAMFVLEAEALVGTGTGKCEVKIPAASVSGAHTCCLNLAKTQVLFPTADAVTSARIKFAVLHASNRDALLEAASSTV